MGRINMRLALCLLLAALAGCATTGHAVRPWMPAYDAPWAAATQCWEQRLGRKLDPPRPNVTVRSDCRSKWASQDFLDGAGGAAPKWICGRATLRTVEVCPDLGALKHEFAHVVLGYATGSMGSNGNGCYGVAQ